MSTVEFHGVTYLRSDLPDTLLTYIDAYNDAVAAGQIDRSETNDYAFRMNQALQMFGEPAVIDAIQTIGDSLGIELS